MKAEEINQMTTGQRVRVHCVMYDKPVEAVVVDHPDSTDKFLATDDGNYIFVWEVDKLEVASK